LHSVFSSGPTSEESTPLGAIEQNPHRLTTTVHTLGSDEIPPQSLAEFVKVSASDVNSKELVWILLNTKREGRLASRPVSGRHPRTVTVSPTGTRNSKRVTRGQGLEGRNDQTKEEAVTNQAHRRNHLYKRKETQDRHLHTHSDPDRRRNWYRSTNSEHHPLGMKPKNVPGWETDA